jgi:hypothetical protein
MKIARDACPFGVRSLHQPAPRLDELLVREGELRGETLTVDRDAKDLPLASPSEDRP